LAHGKGRLSGSESDVVIIGAGNWICRHCQIQTQRTRVRMARAWTQDGYPIFLPNKLIFLFQNKNIVLALFNTMMQKD
jgi:hypothetical protein